MRYAFALLFCPVIANAGVVYDFGVQEVDQSNMAPVSSGLPVPAVTRYFVESGKVRVGAAGAKTVYLFKNQTVYIVDDASRSVRVLKHATLSQVIAHYADATQTRVAAVPEPKFTVLLTEADDAAVVSGRLVW